MQSKQSTTTIYVQKFASGNNEGTTWSNAFTSLQDALNQAQQYVDSNSFSIIDVFVAREDNIGYKPTVDTDRSASFRLIDNVNLYGGFVGTETDPSERYWIDQNLVEWDGQTIEGTPLTILTGDIGVTDLLDDNSYHVLSAPTDSSLTNSILDGFFITKGYADGIQKNGNGGGLLLYGPDANTNGHTLTIQNCRFYDNSAFGGGGAIYGFNYPAPSITSTSFEANNGYSNEDKPGNGGAISCMLGCNANIQNSRFIKNYAEDQGGAIAVDYGYEFSVSNTVFDSNQADNHGGAIFGIDRASQLGKTDLNINACTFSNNQAGRTGGAICGWDTAQLIAEDPSTFDANLAVDGGNSISCVDCKTTDELWYSNFGALKDEVIELALENPTIDIQLSTLLDAIDYMQDFTVLDYTENSYGTRIYVASSALGNDDGSSWDNAYTTIEAALNAANQYDEIWVSGGYYITEVGFTIPAYVSLYGSFTQTETSPSERTFKDPTIIDGNSKAKHIFVYNSYVHVDGFIVTGGYGYKKPNGNQFIQTRQGDDSQHTSTSALVNSVSETTGAGILIHFGSLQDENVQNVPDYQQFPASLANIVLLGNIGKKGAGMYAITAEVDMVNVVFLGNEAKIRGGAISVDIGTIVCHDNCQFQENVCTEGKGGAIYADFGPDVTLVNSRLTNNSAANGGGGIAADGSAKVYLKNSKVKENYSNLAGSGLYQGTYQPYVGAPVNAYYLDSNTEVSDNICYDAANPDSYSWGFNTYDTNSEIQTSENFNVASQSRIISITRGKTVGNTDSEEQNLASDSDEKMQNKSEDDQQNTKEESNEVISNESNNQTNKENEKTTNGTSNSETNKDQNTDNADSEDLGEQNNITEGEESKDSDNSDENTQKESDEQQTQDLDDQITEVEQDNETSGLDQDDQNKNQIQGEDQNGETEQNQGQSNDQKEQDKSTQEGINQNNGGQNTNSSKQTNGTQEQQNNEQLGQQDTQGQGQADNQNSQSGQKSQGKNKESVSKKPELKGENKKQGKNQGNKSGNKSGNKAGNNSNSTLINNVEE